MLPVSVSSGVDRRMCEVDNSHLYNALVKLNADVLVFPTGVINWRLIFAERIYFLVWIWRQEWCFFFNLFCVFVQNVECLQKIAADGGLCLKIAVRRNTAHLNYIRIMPLNCRRRVRIRNFSMVYCFWFLYIKLCRMKINVIVLGVYQVLPGPLVLEIPPALLSELFTIIWLSPDNVQLASRSRSTKYCRCAFFCFIPQIFFVHVVLLCYKIEIWKSRTDCKLLQMQLWSFKLCHFL